jgi:GMP synthase-like glutamine amidotransferase
MSTDIPNFYNHYTKCHLFLYNYSNSRLRLLMKKTKNEEKFSELSSNVLTTDFISIITISRIFSVDLRGIFTDNNFELILNHSLLKKENLSKPRPWYSIQNDPVCVEWIKKFTTNLIQYDSIPGKVIYFYEMPNIDLDFLNINLKDLDIDYEFIYYQYDNNELLKSETLNMIHNLDFKKHIEDSINILNNQNLINRYIVLSCDSDPNNFSDFLRISFFYSLYRKNNENWRYYFRNEFTPDNDILSKTKCIMIPGSSLHIYECSHELTELKNKVIRIIQEHKTIKFLGICFGHQFLNYCHGSDVERMNKRITHSHDIYLDESFFEYEFIKNSKIQKKNFLSVNKYHYDEVVYIPDNFRHLGKSEICKNEIILSNDMRILTFQGHPEYNKEMIFYINNREYLSNADETDFENLYSSCLELKKEENFDLRNVCYNFIKC